jgi:hypothetical protein
MTIVEKLGFEKEDRVVVVHVDDIGMCRASNRGALRALEGVATCGSLMVPCPAFPEVARIARERSDLDLGVHLTLNAEFAGYRWGPVCDDVPSLVSPDGGMWRTTEETVSNATPEEVERELRAQVDRALESGIDVTHLDSHMGTVLDPKFIDVYVQLGLDYRLPVFLPRVSRLILEGLGMADRYERYAVVMDRLAAAGLPIFDHVNADSLSFGPGTGAEHNARRVAGLGPGLSYLIIHAAEGDAELEAITEDWRQRDEEHRIYSDGTMADTLAQKGVRTVGMAPLRALVRS